MLGFFFLLVWGFFVFVSLWVFVYFASSVKYRVYFLLFLKSVTAPLKFPFLETQERAIFLTK